MKTQLKGQATTIEPTSVIAQKTMTVNETTRTGGVSIQTQKESATAFFVAICGILQRRFGFTEAVQARLNEFFQTAMQTLLTENVSVRSGNRITIPVFSRKLLSSLQNLGLNGTTDQLQIDAGFWQISDRDQSSYRNGPFYFIHDVAISVPSTGKQTSETVQQQIDSFENDGRFGLTVRECATAIFALAASSSEPKTVIGTTFVAAGSIWGDRTGTPTLTGSAIERIPTDEPVDSSYCVPSYGHSSGSY